MSGRFFENWPISCSLSQGALWRSKYSSGVFSINFPHSDWPASALTENISSSLSMGLIEQGMISNHHLIPLSLLSLFIQNYQHTLLKKKYSFFLEFCGVVFWFEQLEKLKGLIQYQTLINDFMLGVGLDEFIYLFIYLFNYKAIWLLTIYWNSHVFTETIIPTKCNDKNKKLLFELVLRLI